ncbi:MAG TPA: hypothetical protein VEJ63_22540 [Planctomycetota bacterium]|nr:hypothetical protein [Planctomycetota bacterium]
MIANHLRILAALSLIAVQVSAAENYVYPFSRDEIQIPLGKLLAFKIEGTALQIRREAWDEPIPTETQHPMEAADLERVKAAKSPPAVFLAARLVRLTNSFSKAFRLHNEKDRQAAEFGSDDIIARVELTGGAADISVTETKFDGRLIRVREDTEMGLQLKFRSKDGYSVLTQLKDGAATLTSHFKNDPAPTILAAPSFNELLKSRPDFVQMRFLRPLADCGVTFAPHKYLPPVMAVATGGYSPAASETAMQAADLIKKVASDDQDEREKATQELIKLYPRAIYSVIKAHREAKDLDLQTRLERVIVAHPGILKAREYVDKEKLHENREYLKDILANVPFFKAAARARLAQLYGKDHGDDPKDWP